MIHLKSEREIELMRASADLVGRTLGEVAKLIAPGVSTQELDAVAEAFVRDHGAEPAFKGYKVGRHVFPATLCTSVNDEVVHGIPGEDVILKEGDLVSVDCGVELEGYFGDSAFTFGVGALDPEDARLCKVTYEALYKGIEQAVKGSRIGDISAAVYAHCDEHGFGVVRDLVGHGIGRKLHEAPQVPNYGRRGQGRKLKQGLTICIEPMVNRGVADVFTEDDGWTVRTGDGLASAHYEHMVVVRGGEAEVLTTFQYIEDVIATPYQQASEQLTHG